MTLDVHPHADPCRRPFFRPSLADEFVLKVWRPEDKRCTVDVISSAFIPSRVPMFSMDMIVRNRCIESVLWGVN